MPGGGSCCQFPGSCIDTRCLAGITSAITALILRPIFKEQLMTMRDQGSVMANAIRSLAMDGVEKAKSGHPGLPMGAADVATVLFSRFMNFDPSDTHWPDRDRFILSAGHGSMLLYALLHLVGVESMTIDELKNFRQMNSLTPGHLHLCAGVGWRFDGRHFTRSACAGGPFETGPSGCVVG